VSQLTGLKYTPPPVAFAPLRGCDILEPCVCAVIFTRLVWLPTGLLFRVLHNLLDPGVVIGHIAFIVTDMCIVCASNRTPHTWNQEAHGLTCLGTAKSTKGINFYLVNNKEVGRLPWQFIVRNRLARKFTMDNPCKKDRSFLWERGLPRTNSAPLQTLTFP